MLRLPADLEHKLRELFPKFGEREKFIVKTLRDAIGLEPPEEERMPQSVGGTLHLFTDGASRGNPGQAAVAWIIEDPSRGVVLEERGETIGIETNNVAEYRALIEGMRHARKYCPNRLICSLDSELVTRQLNGEYRVKMPTLQPLVDEIKALGMEFPDVVFQHIPRSDNFRADRLVNQALDANPNPPVR